MDLQLNVLQKQILSQKMIQSLNILQMNAQELQDYLKEASLNNPLLEYDDSLDYEKEKQEVLKKLEWLGSSDEQNKIYYTEDSLEDNNVDKWDFALENENSLQEYILSQFILNDLTTKERNVLEYLTYSLDSNGYITEDMESICKHTCSDTITVDSCLTLLKTADPAGVGAKDLQECLLLQLERKGEAGSLLQEIVVNYLDLMGKNQLPEIAKKLHISMDETLKLCQEIRQLNPKPGNGFYEREYLRYIRPDITIIKFEDRLEILLNDNSSDKVLINSYYSKMLGNNIEKNDFNYIKEKMNQAEWIMQCVQQRNSTLLKVVRSIVYSQKLFFEKGPGNIQPFLMKDVADQIEMHESVVSRAVKNKYLQCSWGIFPLSYFFSKKIKHVNSNEVNTPEYVKTRIRCMIENEDAKKPYSDQKLSDMLKEEDIDISRRTVAKYRDEMEIRDTRGRKKYFN